MTSAFDTNTKTLASSEEAVSAYVGEQFLEWLLNYITHQVKTWPELKQIAESQPKFEKIKKFMLQRFLASQAFLGGRDGDPGFLGFAIANLSESSDPLAENALGILEQKKQEELGEAGTASNKHQELWLRLLNALEVTPEEIARAEAKEPTRNYISELSDTYSAAEWQTAMGAFLAHERSIPDEYAALLSLLKQNTPVSDQDVEVLTWHAGVDLKYVVNTSHMLENIVVDQESKKFVLDGVNRQLIARKDFYEGLLKNLLG